MVLCHGARTADPRKGSTHDRPYRRVVAHCDSPHRRELKTVRHRIVEGALPAYRSGRILRLNPDDVDAMFCRFSLLTGSEFTQGKRRQTRTSP